jgi:diguanylate cyclase (GGDEF)-like protein/PAS domain S-box-containing protein
MGMSPADPLPTAEELSRLNLLRAVDLEAIRPLLRGSVVRLLAADEVLIAAEQPNDSVYLLLDGRLRIHLRSPEQPPLVLLDAGDTVGELSLIDRQPTSAFVVADAPSRVLVVSEATMWSLVEASHAVSLNLLRTLSHRLRHDNRLIYLDREELRRRVEELEAERQALHRTERRYQTLYNLNPSMLFTVDLEGVVLSANIFGAAQLGYGVDELVGRPIWPHYASEDRAYARQQLESCLVDQGIVQRWDARTLRRDGSYLWVRQTARAIADGEGDLHVLIVCEDVTESRQLSEQLAYQASHDPLTGLVNRRAFEERLERALDVARTEQVEHALCYLDLDQFKVINDTCGHVAGDELLRQLSRVLQSVVSKRDTLARLGGDEFGVLLERCDVRQAERVAYAVRQAVEGYQLTWENRKFKIGVSIGLVPVDRASDDMGSVLLAADAACYAAKEAGRNRIHVFDQTTVALMRRRGDIDWVDRINDGLEHGLLFLEYQPILDLSSDGACQDVEILLRLRDRDGRTHLPDAFLPTAERFRLSVRIDSWVVTEVLAWLRANRGRLDCLRMCSINLSAQSIVDEGFLGFVLAQITRHEVPPTKLCFEVSERAAVSYLAAVDHFIWPLREIGCRFALDDFGSGWSSFTYLKYLPVDFVKISGEFTRGILDRGIDFAIVKSIGELARAMGSKTIAEAVEDGAILAALREPQLGIDFAQGFGIARPRPLAELA